MKGKIRKGFALLLALELILTASAALAGTSIKSGFASNSNPEDKIQRILEILDFKFFVKKTGIGYGTCPVYSAPSESAWRAANGKAACDTNDKMSVGGFDQTGWLMVRYETNNGNTRVGYIPPRYVKGYRADVMRLDFDYIPVEAAETIYVTDNPMLQASAFAQLDPGEEFHLLAKYTYYGNWWYIECTVDGQLARGFIDREVSKFKVDGEVYTPQVPARSPLGTERTGTVRVLPAGNAKEGKIVRRDSTINSDMVARVFAGEEYPCYASKKGYGNMDWHYIWIDGVWGWIASGISEFMPEQ